MQLLPDSLRERLAGRVQWVDPRVAPAPAGPAAQVVHVWLDDTADWLTLWLTETDSWYMTEGAHCVASLIVRCRTAQLLEIIARQDAQWGADQFARGFLELEGDMLLALRFLHLLGGGT